MSIKQKALGLISLIVLVFTASCSVLFTTGSNALGNNEKNAICDYEIPQGYSEQFVISIADLRVISLIGQEESSHIYLVGLPDDVEIDLGDSTNSVGVLVGRDDDNRADFRMVDEQTVTIHGQQVTLVINEGENSNNQLFREATAVFQSDNGLTLVNISSTQANWNQELVNAFLASLN